MRKFLQGPFFLGLLISFLLVGAIFGVFYLIRWWNTPLGAPLDLSTPTPSQETPAGRETPTAQPGLTDPVPTPSPTPTFLPTFTPSPTVLSQPEPLCGGPETMIIQVTGVNATDYIMGLGDAIRIVRVDFIHGKVDVLPLPRDLWVDVPVSLPGRTEGITPGKLSQAYYYGSPGTIYYDGEDQSPGLLAKTLDLNFGLEVDHYLSVNTKIFRKIVDQIGGLEVSLPRDVYGHHKGERYVYLEAGTHDLDGKQVEMVARLRTWIGDFGRLENQSILLKALAKKLLSPQDLKELPGLIDIYQEDVLMSFTPNQISQLICLASEIDWKEDITFVPFPEDMVEGDRVYDKAHDYNASVLVGDRNELRTLLLSFQGGIWP